MASIEPKFRNSGLLNNCGFGAALPVILNAFKQYAQCEDEQSGYVLDQPHTAHHTPYQALKEAVAECYGIEKDRLGFTQVLALFDSLQNNYAQQAVMGLALRQFMQANGAPESLTSIQSDGRFKPLNAKELNEYVYQPLGINLVAHQSSEHQSVPPEVFDSIDKPLATISIHIQDNNHFEPKPRSLLSTLSSDRALLSQACPDIENTIVNITSGIESREKTQQGILAIKKAVQNRYAQAIAPVTTTETLPEQTPQQKFVAFKGELTHLYQNHGLFGKSNISPENIDTATANQHESDEEFAHRLQLAEFELHTRTP